MVRTAARLWTAIAIVALSSNAIGSGGPAPQPAYVANAPQDPREWAVLTAGQPGVVKAGTTAALLYANWRVLNGLALDAEATTALATPCCDTPGDDTYKWLAARRELPDLPALYFVSTERPGPNYTSIPTCFDDAFVTAAATLADRARRFGKQSAAVKAWVAAQDAVFEACGKPGVALPPLPTDAPEWLRADHAYQEAALALYDGRTDEAAQRFAAIARDRRSPWQKLGPYLEARALQRAARLEQSPARFAAAHAAIKRLAAAPRETYGRGEIERMRQVLAFREDPRGLLARLDRELGARTPMPEIAVAFRDYLTLSDRAQTRPEAAAWIRAIGLERPDERAATLETARGRWTGKHRSAWLLAALSLAEPTDAVTKALVTAGEQVATRDPAWLSVRYHLLRLTIGASAPAAIRAQADAILAGDDLSRSDRNLFLAIRTQSATDLADLVRQGLRTPYCDAASGSCIDGNSFYEDGLIAPTRGGFVGFGPDARAIIDRLPLDVRLSLASDPEIPAPLRLDIALTSYARAVQLQDEAAIDRLATSLVVLLPQLADDWRRIAATPPGPAKRFAEFFAMAKIPSLRTDLADHERPTGTEREFGGYWVDWRLVDPRRAPPPAPLRDARDLTCMGQCGAGAFPLHLPAFVEATWPRALDERRRFVTTGDAPSVWNDALSYVQAHPKDPRAAETLYRLIRVARWGANPDHLGRRAFRLLHARYPQTRWAELSPYYYDS